MNKIWREAKLRGAGMKRAKILITAAEHSVGSQETPESAGMELRNLLNDYAVYKERQEELLQKMQEKLMEIKGIGLITVSGFIAEAGDISRFDNPKQLQKLAGYAIVDSSSGKHQGERNPLKKMQSVIAVACKILRVFYAILTKGVDYDGRELMKDIRRPQLNAA